MMAKRVKELYLAQNFADLNKQSEVVGSFNLSPDRILGSMEKAFDSGRKDQDAGDEELAYVKYMRVIALGTQLRRMKNCSDVVNRRLSVVVNDALLRAEALQVSLSKRYTQRVEQKQRLLEQQQQQQQSSTPVVTNGVVDGPAGLASIDDDDDVDDGDMDEILSDVAISAPAITSVGNKQTINCMMLARHIERGDYSLLVLDCRPKDDFLASHIQHQWVVNVPSNSVQPGMTPHAIETILPDVSRSRWQNRHDVDMLVLMDWGSDPPQNPIQPKLAALLGALKLDYDKKYRSTFLILQGGYEAWLSQFPRLTTNPNVNKPADEPASNGVSAQPSVVDSPWKSPKSMLFPSSSSSLTATTKDAGDERKSRSNTFYPKLEGFSLKKRPTTATSMEETDVGFHRKRGHHSPHAPTPASAPAPALVPTVNRSTKPAFLDRMLRKKASNGSVSPVGSVTSLDSSISPFSSIPFETNKPNVDRGKKPPELVASLAAAKREAERIDDEYLTEIRAAEQNERELRLLELEASRMSSLKRNKEHEERERRLLDRLRKSEEARTKLSEEAETNRQELESLRAKLLASGESVAANGQYQDENNQDDESLMEVVHEKAAEKLRLEQEVRRMREERKAGERRRREKEQEEEEERRKREAEMEALRERQHRIEEEKKKKQEAEEARIKAELAERKRVEEKEKRDREEQLRENKRKVEAIDAKRRTIYHERLKEEDSGGSSGGGGSPGGLTRSHSSPNIDQLGTASPERGSSAASISNYDRQLKRSEYERDPFLCRRRNFAEVHGTTVPGRTGLKNLGNTCYMNATIQCLGNAPFLTKYFMEQKFLDDLNTNCDTKGEMARELYLVLRHLWSARYRNIAMHDFKELVGKYYFLFRGYEQQDCHEFLVTLLAWLRDDLNRVKTKTRSVSLDIDKIPDDIEAAKVAWDAFIATEHSIFTDSFGGLQKSTLLCESCGDRSRTFEPIFELSLPLPSKNRCSLEDCIREYLHGERLADRVCPRCHRKGHTIKKFHVWKFPHILIIHLKRFEKGGGRLEKKLQNLVDFRLDDLDLTEFATAPPGADVPTSSSPTKFDLFAVTNHYGTMDGGHYTAYCRNRGISWCKYDDQSVEDMPAKDVKSAAAYVLYFAEKNLLKPLCYPKT